MPEYGLILLALFIITLSLHFFYKIKIFKNTKQLVIVYAVILIIGTIWDNFALSRGHWTFGQKFLIGKYVGLMPVEEYGFIVVVAYFGLVLYKIAENYSK